MIPSQQKCYRKYTVQDKTKRFASKIMLYDYLIEIPEKLESDWYEFFNFCNKYKVYVCSARRNKMLDFCE